MSQSRYDVKPGEVWQDNEGTLMAYHREDLWWVFGVYDPISENKPGVVHPMSRVFDVTGAVWVDRLAYPNGSAFRDGRTS